MLVVVVVLAAVAAPAALALRFTDDSYFVPKATVGQPYSHWFKGDGGCGPGLPYQFRILGGELPPGLSLRTDGLLNGTPTQAGSWSFWVELSDQDPPTASWCRPTKSEREFTVVVSGGAVQSPLEITTGSAPLAAATSRYSLALRASGGGQQSWSVVSGHLPPGFILAANGSITGTPTRAGTYTFVVRVADGARADTQKLTIVVRPRLAIATKRFAPVTVGRLFRAAVMTSGGVGRVRYEIAGRLPTGVRLNTSSGLLLGRPRKAGTYRFTIRVRDGLGVTSTRTFVLSVRRSA
jgi:hypothetical protein